VAETPKPGWLPMFSSAITSSMYSPASATPSPSPILSPDVSSSITWLSYTMYGLSVSDTTVEPSCG